MTYFVKTKALPPSTLTIDEAKARWNKHLKEKHLSNIAFEYGIKSNRAILVNNQHASR